MISTAVGIRCLCKSEFHLIRPFHTGLVSCAREARIMKKVMGATSKKKRVFFDAPVLPSSTNFAEGVNQGKHSPSARRSSVLNKLFMSYITDLMAHGENCQEFLGHGIEINRVRIAPDFRGLNVYWVAKGTINDEIVEKLLEKNSGYLRHELSGLRVMGVVPKIYFVKDKQYAKVLEVDQLLNKADFGEDYEPTNLETRLKSKLQLHSPLSSDDREAVKQLEYEEDEDEVEEPIPQMPQNVFGVNHSDILTRVKKLLKKSKAVHRQDTSMDARNVELSTNENPIVYRSSKEQRESFKKFLHQRELLKMKARREQNQILSNIDLSLEEPENFDNEVEEFEDYIVEEK